MEQALTKAKGILMGLNEIQPGVSVQGLDTESKRIAEMKIDIVELVGALTPADPQLRRVVDSCRHDALSSLSAFSNLVPVHYTGASDDQLQHIRMAAENFVKRCNDYFSSKESYLQQSVTETPSPKKEIAHAG